MDLMYRLKGVKDIFDSTVNGLMIVEKSGTVAMFNAAASRITGKKSEKVIGELLNNIFPELWLDINSVIETGVPRLEKKHTLKNTLMLINQAPIFDDDSVIGAISVIQDISELENISGELEAYKKLNEELDAIINASFDGFWICDHEGKVIRINKASSEISGVKPEEVIGKKMDNLVRDGLVNRSVTLEVIEKKSIVTLVQEQKTGKLVLSTGSPLFDRHGNVRLVVVNERDLTELHNLRLELEESKRLNDRYRSEINSSNDQKELLSEIVIRSKNMQIIFDTAIRVAKVDSTVMIQGESGVGKSHFAKLIHQASDRRQAPFIRVDCSSIPESLIESELFGYEAGAFSGALTKGKAGLFQMADKGTLFLDEIGDIQLNLQVKLLRFLDDKSVIRLGGTKEKKINTRVIVATNRNLDEMVKEGKFRNDLFFRLNVVPLVIPSLKERSEELPHLISFFLDKFNKKCSLQKTLSPKTLEYLCCYTYPGNIRELANIIERLVVLSAGNLISDEDLPANIKSNIILSNGLKISENNWNLPQAVARLEVGMIIEAVNIFGSQRKAAKALGVDQSTLTRKLKRYNINK
jgi:PAS domain S-box-containing protein